MILNHEEQNPDKRKWENREIRIRMIFEEKERERDRKRDRESEREREKVRKRLNYFISP